MKELEHYIDKLENKEEIRNIDKKMVNQELKIHKMEIKWSITKKCVEEMEKRLSKLEDKSIQFKGNQKIGKEIKSTKSKLKKGQKALSSMNKDLTQKEVSLIKLKQKRKKLIVNGLARYNKQLKLKHQKLLNEGSEDLRELEDEIEHIGLLIKNQ